MAATLNLLIIRELKHVGFITNNLLLVAEEYVFQSRNPLWQIPVDIYVSYLRLNRARGIIQQ